MNAGDPSSVVMAAWREQARQYYRHEQERGEIWWGLRLPPTTVRVARAKANIEIVASALRSESLELHSLATILDNAIRDLSLLER